MTSTDIAASIIAAAEKPDRMAAHRAAAVAAVMHHVITRGLFDPSNTYADDETVYLSLRTHTFAAWAASLNLEGEPASRPGSDEVTKSVGPCRHWTAVGRTPDYGIRVEISGHMLADREEVA